MEDEEDDEEEEHATERRSFASVSTSPQVRLGRGEKLVELGLQARGHAFRQLQTCLTTQSSSWDSALQSMVRAMIRS